jgi:dUTP pyrophosphatase
MIVKVKKTHPNAVLPTYAHPSDAGADLTAVWVKYAGETDKPYTEYGTGLSFEIPEGYVGLLFQRSSVSKQPLTLANAVGVLDSGFRGEVTYRYKGDALASVIMQEHQHDLEEYLKHMRNIYHPEAELGYKVGDKIGQLIIMPYPKVAFTEVEELATSERGEGGYGSTGQ